MCGICGIFHFDNNKLVGQEELLAMSACIAHRGPDDSGHLIDRNLGLAHRRLSIIDLSPAAHQPMSSADDRFWIIYNGEIYNYIEIRKWLQSRGYSFKTQSDTEVILQCFIHEGSECVKRLNGMFAFVIWDTKERKLFAARDHFGIKPFYYSIEQDSFLFASEIKALFPSGLIKPNLNPDGLADYLTFQFCLGEKTLFANVKKLLPGHVITIEQSGNVEIQKYWDVDFTVDTDHTTQYFEQQLISLFRDSVRLQLRADVPVGAHLSGGLDSSTVTSLAAAMLDSSFHTFMGGFKDGKQFDETYYASRVAKKANTIHHEIFPTASDFVESLPKLIYAMDEPAAGPGIFPQYFVSKLAKEHVKVVLGGQGGDEVFGGYIRYLVAYLEECIRGGIEETQEEQKYVVSFDTILPNLPQLNGYQPLLRKFWSDGVFGSQDARYFRLIDRGEQIRKIISTDLFNLNHEHVFAEYQNLFNQGNLGSYINKMTRFDIMTLLPALLHVEDRTSMMVSLESRVPLLDHRIVELAASMPPKIKFKGGRAKHIFREVVKDLLPEEIIERQDKMGFPVPLSIWYEKDPVRTFIRDILLGESAKKRGWYSTNAVEQIISRERTFGRSIWGLLCLELWAQTFFDSNLPDQAIRY